MEGDRKLDFSAILVPVISLVMAQSIIMDLAQFRFNKKKLFIILVIEIFFQVAINGPILVLGGLALYAKWYILTMDVPVILTFFYISKRRDFRDLFTILTTVFINFIIYLVAIWVAHLSKQGYWTYNFTRIILFSIIFFVLHKFIRKRYMQIQDEIEKGWGIYSMLPLIGSIVIYLEYIRYSFNKNIVEVLLVSSVIVVFMIIIFVVFYYVFIELHDKYLVQEQKRILSIQNKAQRDQFISQKEAAEKTNRRWHDLRHNTEELIGLLEAGNTDMALAYLKEQRGMNDIPKEEYCLHQPVNSILCFWSARAKKEGVSVEIRTDVPENLAIDGMELSALFANAFENAYNACLRLPKTNKRYIKVESKYNGKRLAIGFTNSCSDEVTFEGDLPVSQKEGGGIGTKSMTYTVSRYQGTSYFEAVEGEFIARFVLNV